MATVRFVDIDAAAGANDGSSWGNAYTDLQDAIDVCAVNDTIWVAEGTYLPTKDHTGNASPVINRDKNFHISSDMKIFGGFTGTETLLSQRDWATNVTTLSGDFVRDDAVTGGGATLSFTGNGENAFHVLITAGLTIDAVIDGLTILGGNANSTGNIPYLSQNFARNSGGGMFNVDSSPSISNSIFIHNSSIRLGGGMCNLLASSPLITNSIFKNNKSNFGGGVFNYLNSSPIITNCSFLGNCGLLDGGGAYNSDSSPSFNFSTFSRNYGSEGGGMINVNAPAPSILNCNFNHNVSSHGGGIYNSNSNGSIINTIFNGNESYWNGGGLENQISSPTLINLTFYKNSSWIGGGIYSDSDLAIYSSIFWENYSGHGSSSSGYNSDITAEGNGTIISVYNCLTQLNSGYSSGPGIINNQDPQFVDVANENFQLKCSSPAINKGNVNSWNTSGIQTDIAGNQRPFGTTSPDMGAYEYQGVSYNNTIYTKGNAGGSNNGSSWADAYVNLQDAIDNKYTIDNKCGNSNLDIWVASGTYLPTLSPDGSSDLRNKAFYLATDMNIYGGFLGTETQLSERDWTLNKTILSGDFSGDDQVTGSGAALTITANTENAYHVMTTANLTNASTIDGFTIKSGNANGADSFVYASSQLFKNRGGGILNYNSSPNFRNSNFEANSSMVGGGMFNESSSSPNITNAIFYRNAAYVGGGIYNHFSSSPNITNATFYGNAALIGGGINNFYSSPHILNSIFWDNTQAGSIEVAGADITNDGGSPIVTFCLTQKNSLFSTGTNILNNQSPLFFDAASGVFNLKCNSPAINEGSITEAPQVLPEGGYQTWVRMSLGI
jgi:hypothetical protein